MPTIILTGFAPFGGSESNPSQQIVESLHGKVIGGAQVAGLALPVVMSKDWERLRGAIDGGEPALFSTLDTERVAAAIRREAGVPARAHGYAGSYACNHILYRALHYAESQGLSYKAGFIHLPLSSEQVIAENTLHLPSLPLPLMIAGVRAALTASLKLAGQ